MSLSHAITADRTIAPNMLQPLPDRLIGLDRVMEIVGLGKTLIYRLIGDGAFPKQIKLGQNASRWSESEIFSWIAERAAARPLAS